MMVIVLRDASLVYMRSVFVLGLALWVMVLHEFVCI